MVDTVTRTGAEGRRPVLPGWSPTDALRALAAAALLLRLGGIWLDWLPSTGTLVAGLVIAYGLTAVVRARGSGTSHDRWWQALATHWFGTSLGMLSVAGVLYRVFDIGFDLGHTPINIDEGRLASSVLHFLRTGAIDHTTVEHYPGVHFWLLAGVYLGTYLWALVSGIAETLESVPLETFVLAGRITSSVLGAGTIALTGFVGRALFNERSGLLAAGLVAIAPLAERVSTSLRNDETLVLLVLASVLSSVSLYRSEKSRWALIAGCLAGAATGVKYSGVFSLLPALAGSAVRPLTASSVRRLALTLVGFGTVLAATNHYLWADVPNFLRQLSDQIAITGEGHWAATDNPAWFYTRIIAESGTGWPLLILAAIWVALALAGGRSERWLLLAFPLAYLGFMSNTPSQLPRWVYPMVPFAAVAGSGALWSLVDWVAERWTVLWPHTAGLRPVAAGALVLAATTPLSWAATVEFSRRLTPPTYQVASKWIADQSSATDTVLVENGWLDLTAVDSRVRRVPSLLDVLGGGRYQVFSNDWIVVPEPDFYRVDVSRLFLAREVLADYGFGGNQGGDFRIYASPKPVLVQVPLQIQLGTEASVPYLGLEWSGDGDGGGLEIPEHGARFFLPPVGQDEFRILLRLTGTEPYRERRRANDVS